MTKFLKSSLQLWPIFILICLTVPTCCSKRFFNLRPPKGTANSKPSTTLSTTTTTEKPSTKDISVGPCTWVINRKCPDNDVKFYLYTRMNPKDRQSVHIDETIEKSNISSSYFNPKAPTKIIIHGYNSDMFLSPLKKMRDEYLLKGEYNIFYVDWSKLSPGPCYISAVHNTRHAGTCVALLVQRILDLGSQDMHVIGFSLGAHLSNYIAQNLDSFVLPRITGLDPAMPLFITAQAKDKLDKSDANFVDVIHTNGLVQGKLERCGHADFYMNGGIMQPGCSSRGTNPFACSHQRAPAYFLESIRTQKGFWGWACSSYLSYMLGMCPPTNYLVEAGENVRWSTKGMFLINTNDTSPYALGKWTDLPTLGSKQPTLVLKPPKQHGDPLIKQVDQWGKLDSNYNNMEYDEMIYEWSNLHDNNWDNYVSGGGNHHEDNDDSIEEEEQDDSIRNENDEENSDEQSWNEYRRNLTMGFIDNSIFQIPKLKNVSRNRKRG